MQVKTQSPANLNFLIIYNLNFKAKNLLKTSFIF